MKGHVVGFGSPEWAKTHPAATSTAPTILALLQAGATCVGTNVTDELAYRFGLGSIVALHSFCRTIEFYNSP